MQPERHLKHTESAAGCAVTTLILPSTTRGHRRSLADAWSVECCSCSIQGWHHANPYCATVWDFPIECEKVLASDEPKRRGGRSSLSREIGQNTMHAPFQGDPGKTIKPVIWKEASNQAASPKRKQAT